jgi:hypothetical protein
LMFLCPFVRCSSIKTNTYTCIGVGDQSNAKIAVSV